MQLEETSQRARSLDASLLETQVRNIRFSKLFVVWLNILIVVSFATASGGEGDEQCGGDSVAARRRAAARTVARRQRMQLDILALNAKKSTTSVVRDDGDAHCVARIVSRLRQQIATRLYVSFTSVHFSI